MTKPNKAAVAYHHATIEAIAAATENAMTAATENEMSLDDLRSARGDARVAYRHFDDLIVKLGGQRLVDWVGVR
jgi:hypothetical protein